MTDHSNHGQAYTQHLKVMAWQVEDGIRAGKLQEGQYGKTLLH